MNISMVQVKSNKRNLDHIKMTRAVDKNGTVVTIENADNGKGCNCYCIECDSPLIAKQGDDRAKHFAHDFSNGKVMCKWSGETELHLRVKDYLEKSPSLLIPIGINNPTIQSLPIDDVQLEMRHDPTRRIPDVTILSNGEKILVEIAVTHFCDKNKISEYKSNNVNTIELDFSRFDTDNDVITDNDIEKHLKNVRDISKLLSVSPTGELGQRFNNHERKFLNDLLAEIKSKEQEGSDEETKRSNKIKKLSNYVDTLSNQVEIKKAELEKIKSQIDKKTPESEDINSVAAVRYMLSNNRNILDEHYVNFKDINNLKSIIQKEFDNKNKYYLNYLSRLMNRNEANKYRSVDQVFEALNDFLIELNRRETSIENTEKMPYMQRNEAHILRLST